MLGALGGQVNESTSPADLHRRDLLQCGHSRISWMGDVTMGTRGATNVYLQKARLNGNRCLCANWFYEHAARVAHTTLINNSRVLVSGGTGMGSDELYES